MRSSDRGLSFIHIGSGEAFQWPVSRAGAHDAARTLDPDVSPSVHMVATHSGARRAHTHTQSHPTELRVTQCFESAHGSDAGSLRHRGDTCAGAGDTLVTLGGSRSRPACCHAEAVAGALAPPCPTHRRGAAHVALAPPLGAAASLRGTDGGDLRLRGRFGRSSRRCRGSYGRAELELAISAAILLRTARFTRVDTLSRSIRGAWP